jgi:hypothetical protein
MHLRQQFRGYTCNKTVYDLFLNIILCLNNFFNTLVG